MDEVIFPLDESFPQYQLAKQQMTGACGLLTFIIKTNRMEAIESFCESLQHMLMAVSWGGHESLIIPRCAAVAQGEFDAGNREHRMLRMYVGLEDADYLIKDLEQAFEKII